MFKDWWRFIAAVARHWGVLVSGVIVTIATYGWGQVRYHYQIDGPDIPFGIAEGVALLLVFVATFLAWRDERQAKVATEEALEAAHGNRPRPLIRPAYLAERMSIVNSAQALWFENVGEDTAFNIRVDDITIGKCLIQIGGFDSLMKGGGRDRPVLRGSLEGRPFGTTSPSSEGILETAIYMVAMNVGEPPESDLQSEGAVIDHITRGPAPGAAVHEWPLVIRYEDSRGARYQYQSTYTVRLDTTDWKLSFVHVESPTPVAVAQ